MSMKLPRLGVRSLNDYYRRSVLSYLSLRYALEADALKSDRWATEIAPEIVEREQDGGYLVSKLFKEVRAGKFIFRDIGSPGPNEALAEAALLEACGKAGSVFARSSDVFSYRLARNSETGGSFSPYFEHYKKRQRAIGRCCRKHRDHIVFCADIRNFYPTLSRARVRVAWNEACAKSKLEDKWRLLGNHLLNRQKRFVKRGLLVGPMFSHLLADLSLRDIDRRIRKKYPGRYFRYVDDIAIVLLENEIAPAKRLIAKLLRTAGLRFHPNKFSATPTAVWAKTAPWQGRASSVEVRDKKWMALIDRIKCYLLKKPDEIDDLGAALRMAGVRIPLPKYRNALSDQDYQERLRRRMQTIWFRQYVKRLTIKKVVAQSKRAVIGYLEEFAEHWTQYGAIEDRVQRKWHSTKIKNILGKLTMLAPEELLPLLLETLEPTDEFAPSRSILDAIRRRNVTDLISFGGSVCGAAGQILSAHGGRYACRPKRWSAQARQGLATLLLMGVDVEDSWPIHVRRDLLIKFSLGEFSSNTWRTTKSSFGREVMAICRGVDLNKNRHLLSSPLNPDDEWLLLSDEINLPILS
jgi:hypothetical protein